MANDLENIVKDVGVEGVLFHRHTSMANPPDLRVSRTMRLSWAMIIKRGMPSSGIHAGPMNRCATLDP